MSNVQEIYKYIPVHSLINKGEINRQLMQQTLTKDRKIHEYYHYSFSSLILSDLLKYNALLFLIEDNGLRIYLDH